MKIDEINESNFMSSLIIGLLNIIEDFNNSIYICKEEDRFYQFQEFLYKKLAEELRKN